MFPEVFKQAFFSLGMTAGQITELSDDTKQRLMKLVVAGAASGKLDEYLNVRLRWIEERENAPPPPPPPPASKSARATVVTGEFDDDEPRPPRPRRPR